MSATVFTSRQSSKFILLALYQHIATLVHVAIQYRQIWTFLSSQDIQSRFRRSYLGMGWLIIQNVLFAVGAAYVWSIVFSVQFSHFLPFISAGFAVWGMITFAFIEGCNVFINSQGFVRQVSLPLGVYICRSVSNSVFNGIFGLGTALLIVAIFGTLTVTGFIYFVLGTLLLLITIIFVTGSMAYLGAIFRDLPPALTGILQILFILTPVIYSPELMIKRGFGYYIHLNPFASLIQIVRAPLIDGTATNPLDLAIAAGFALFFALLFAFLDWRVGRRVIYYL